MNRSRQTRLVLTGALFVVLGFLFYLLGVLLGPIRLVLQNPYWLEAVNEAIVWYSGIPVVLGIAMIAFDLVFLVAHKRRQKSLTFDVPDTPKLVVALTAYNDEQSIADAVRDFLSHPLVEKVIVVSNNSTDRTVEFAESAGAIVYNEPVQGYGACVHRCLSEASALDEYELVVLCEGDLTFRSYDIDKMRSYIPHADIVCGTRIVEQLQDGNTQLSLFMHYGNFFVAKLLELKYLGEATLSDVGTTYKICRTDTLRQVLPRLEKTVNLEFNPYFLETVISEGCQVVECPVTFHPRVGESKGGNIDNVVAFKLGFRMIKGIVFGWSANSG